MNLITSVDNANVKRWCKLKSKKYRDKEGCFLIEGEHLVLEAIKQNVALEVILDSEEIFPIDITKYYVTKEIMRKITSLETPPAMLAVAKKIPEKPYGKKLLLIDSLQDPGNLGTIIRTSVAFNIDTIVLGENTVDLYNEKVLRATQGLIFHINIIKRDLNVFIDELKDNGYMVIGTNVNYGSDIQELNLHDKYAFIMGNEGNGVNKAILDKCNNYVYIPTSDACESLNVAVATGIILYELDKKGDINEK